MRGWHRWWCRRLDFLRRRVAWGRLSRWKPLWRGLGWPFEWKVRGWRTFWRRALGLPFRWKSLWRRAFAGWGPFWRRALGCPLWWRAFTGQLWRRRCRAIDVGEYPTPQEWDAAVHAKRARPAWSVGTPGHDTHLGLIETRQQRAPGVACAGIGLAFFGDNDLFIRFVAVEQAWPCYGHGCVLQRQGVVEVLSLTPPGYSDGSARWRVFGP